MKKFISAKMINLADPRIGSKVIFKTDDFFAAAHRILNIETPVFKGGIFDKHGKWMDLALVYSLLGLLFLVFAVTAQ